MSSRAAWRLELMGFQKVYRYEAGKKDWAASGLEVEGHLAHAPTAATRARTDVPTCSPGERVGVVHQRVKAAGTDFCVVVNDHRIVVGRLRRKSWDVAPDTFVEEAMEEGPTTVRPTILLEDIGPRMQERNVAHVLVSDCDGRLLGVLHREDAQAALRKAV
jgi:CBS domain-containing protein